MVWNKMNSTTCKNKARKAVPAPIKQRLLQHSNFACSICSAIPVVFHHIEEWSRNFSDDEKYLIPICDTCHRSIHGEGGPIFSKSELYDWKKNPKFSKVLTHKYHLGRKHDYSFFIGSNFIASGRKATMFKFGKYPLTSVDVSSGTLKLSLLAGINNDKPEYLIKDNELLINTDDVWNMSFSNPSLKIWRKKDGKNVVFIELIIKEGVVIIKQMNTEFSNKVFRIYQPRKPDKRRMAKVALWIKEAEKDYFDACTQINSLPKVANEYNGVDLDKLIKDSRKEQIKYSFKHNLSNLVEKEFKWSWSYAQRVLDKEFERLQVFREEKRNKANFDNKEVEINKMIDGIKKKYRKIFDDLGDTVVDYGGISLVGNFMF